MGGYPYESAKAGLSIFSVAFVMLAILVAVTFYFLNVQDALIAIAGTFTALWISVGEGASQLDEDIFDGRGTDAERRMMHLKLHFRYSLSVVVFVMTILLVLFF